MQALADGSSRFHIDADHEGFTPLHAAAVEGQAVALLWLCQHGADVAAVKDDGWNDSALHYAAARGHMHCCQVLLAHGAQLDAVNYAGELRGFCCWGFGRDIHTSALTASP
jgi:ankyrin repeat protein